MDNRNTLNASLAGLVIGALIISGMAPFERITWLMEVAPVLIALPLIFFTRKDYPLTTLLTVLIAAHMLVLIAGGAWSYARVPFGFWLQEIFAVDRNPYDKIGHFMQGFVPALIAREILLRGAYIKGRKMTAFLCICVALAISAGYELIEWAAALALGQGADEFLGTQGDVWDTQSDMFMALIGSSTAMALLSGWHDRQLAELTGPLHSKPDVCQPTGTAELPMLDIYMPMMKTAAIVAAGRLGLFQALAEGPLSTAELAGKLQASERGTAMLADFLIAIGYLEQQGTKIANHASTQRWLTRLGQIDYTPGVLWTYEAWPMMASLADAVQSGQPESTLWDAMVDRPELGELFSAYMRAFAQDLGPDLLKHVPIAPQYRRLLDLGGSHGLHSVRFCQRYPQLNSRIVDLPSALGNTPATLASEGLSQRIELSPGNLLDHDWGSGHDVVFYLSVAHNQTADDNRQVIRRIHDALNPGGLLVIHEYLAETPNTPLNAAFRLTLLFETGTQTYAYQDYAGWLTEAGFTSIERINLDPLEKGSLILARR